MTAHTVFVYIVYILAHGTIIKRPDSSVDCTHCENSVQTFAMFNARTLYAEVEWMLTKSHSMAGALLENHCLLRCLRRAFLASSCDRGGTLEDTDRKVS